MRCFQRLLLFGALLSIGPSCGEDSATGSLYVTWKSGTLSCEEMDIQDVMVELFDYGPDPITKTVLCTDGEAENLSERSFQVDGVPPGDYTMSLSGVNRDGCVTHRVRRDISVPEGKVTRLDGLVLDRRRRDLQVNWTFTDGETCASTDIETVSVEARSPSGTDTLTYRWACSGGSVQFLDKRLPSGSLTVSIQGLDREGNVLAYGGMSLGRNIDRVFV